MKATIFILLQLCSLHALSQDFKEADVYKLKKHKVNLKIDSVLSRYNTGNRSCGKKIWSVDQYANLVIGKKINENTITVTLQRNGSGDDMAQIGYMYCIDPMDLNDYFRPRAKFEVGVLSVPFKMRVDPIKFMAGNSIGPCIGVRFRNIEPVVFCSLTNVPLNDMNSAVPETKWGLGFGCGIVGFVQNNFQLGLISGIDLFEGVESWEYRYQPWLSLSIGYSFFTPSKKQQETLKNAK